MSWPVQAVSNQTRRIAIVVERDADLREALTEYLHTQDHRVLGLSTIPALEELSRLQPDLLVIDLLCDGEPISIDTLRQVRSSLAVSAIVATSADSHHDAAYTAEIGSLVSAVLIKPFDLDHFDSAVGLSPS